MTLDERYHPEWPSISRYIRELFNQHCACCGKQCIPNNRPHDLLQVHHIDENPQNNAFENLIPLCAVCHLRIEKEARLHAPFSHVQTELFPETYMTTLQSMRASGLKKYGGTPAFAPHALSQEEFEQFELEQDFNG